MASNIEIHVHRTRDGLWRARVNVGAVPPRMVELVRWEKPSGAKRVKGGWVYTADYTSIGVALAVVESWVDA